MNANIQNIKRLNKVIYQSLFTVCGKLSYRRLTAAITLLANAVHDYPGDSEDIWYLNDGEIPELITGAFWHYTEWHGGQSSPEYAALCALGSVFNPGMTTPEDDNEYYQALNTMAEQSRA